MIRTQMDMHNRSEMVAVLEMSCVISLHNSNSSSNNKVLVCK
jgi:hypothetical protein